MRNKGRTTEEAPSLISRPSLVRFKCVARSSRNVQARLFLHPNLSAERGFRAPLEIARFYHRPRETHDARLSLSPVPADDFSSFTRGKPKTQIINHEEARAKVFPVTLVFVIHHHRTFRAQELAFTEHFDCTHTFDRRRRRIRINA